MKSKKWKHNHNWHTGILLNFYGVGKHKTYAFCLCGVRKEMKCNKSTLIHGTRYYCDREDKHRLHIRRLGITTKLIWKNETYSWRSWDIQ